ncbi:MAG: hypothetical protein R2799_05650 [Crocinitomicaceae bacterium]
MRELEKVAIKFQEVLESMVNQRLSGVCYLTGHCLAEIFSELGYKSRKVTGTHGILMKNKKRYLIYGSIYGKHENVGDYHTWCEVEVDDKVFIVDASTKYNKEILKKEMNIKLYDSVPSVIVTSNKKEFSYFFEEDATLEKLSEEFLKKLEDSFLQKLIDETILKIN